MAKKRRIYQRYQPQRIDDDAWYYEERKGLDLHIWMAPDRALSRGEKYHVNITVPWKLIKATARRAPKKRKVRQAGDL